MKSFVSTLTILFLCFGSFAQNLKWAKSFGGIDYDSGNAMAVDDSENTYITGTFFSDTVYFDTSLGIDSLIGSGGFVAKINGDGNLVWVKSLGGGATGNAIWIDIKGQVYVTGYFNGTNDFDPGAGINNRSTNGNSDVFILKLDVSGNFEWVNSMGGIGGNTSGNDIIVDHEGDVYTIGLFLGPVDFDPGVGSNILTPHGGTDIFISKLDSSGSFIWTKQMGGTLGETGRSIVLDADKNIYTTGSFRGTADFDPGLGTYNLTSKGGSDIFISKLDTLGDFIWAKRIGSTSDDFGTSIIVDENENVITTGNFIDTVDFDPAIGIYNMVANALRDIYILKLDTLGDFLWAKQIGGTKVDYGSCVAVDNTGDIYTTGYFTDTVDFDPGLGVYNLISKSTGLADCFISKLDASGNFLWAKQVGGGNSAVGKSITLDATGNIYVSGDFADTAAFESDSGTYQFVSTGNLDVFVLKLYNDISTGVRSLIHGINFITYPNPATNQLNINLNGLQAELVSIYNVDGKLLSQTKQPSNNRIDISNLANGVYIAEVKVRDAVQRVRWVKM